VPAPKQDYYAILGVLRDSSAEEIRRAYYAAARRLHPDRNKLDGETEIFLEVQQAYEVLSNPKRRALYDATLPREEPDSSVLSCQVEYSRPNLVHLDEPQLVYALLDLAPRNAGQDTTVPLNLCLVLDRSTSMQGEKMDLTKAAAIQIMRMLRPEDIFGIVVFGDRAEVALPSTFMRDPKRLQSRIQSIEPGGATEIFQGLQAGLGEVRRGLDPGRSSHIILLTDGHTYGDEPACLELASEAAGLSVSISGFGIGTDWNDIFLDKLTSSTGSTSTYVTTPQDIQHILVDKFKQLERAFVDDMVLEWSPAQGVQLSYCFRLQPEGGPVEAQRSMHLGSILRDTPLSVLFEFLVEPAASQANSVTLLEGSLKPAVGARPTPIPPLRLQLDRPAASSAQSEPPPAAIQQALSRLALYRLQERARQEVADGEIESATRHLRNLASQLASQGQHELAKTTLLEAENLVRVQAFSGAGGKEIKYGTRALIASPTEKGK
jgi:Ca-activated chloride channel family protein